MYKHQYFDDVPYRLSKSLWILGAGPGRRNATTVRTARRNASQYIPMFPDQICWRFCLPRGVRFWGGPASQPRKLSDGHPKDPQEKWWKVDPRRAIFRKNHEESQFLWGFHWYFQAFAWRPQGHWGLWGGAWLQCVPWQKESHGIPLILSFFYAVFVLMYPLVI